MKIEAGKFYKTRDGEKVFVLGVLVQNPISEEVAEDWQPVVGQFGSGYEDRWSQNGQYETHVIGGSHDLVEEWTEPVPMYRPFASRDEFWPFRNEWIKSKAEGDDLRPLAITNDGLRCPSGLGLVRWKTLYEGFTFSNGDCIGVRNK